MKTVYFATVEEDLSLKMVNVAAWKTHLLPLRGKTVEVTCESRRRSRTSEQNAYYWAVVVKSIADYCGYRTPEEVQGVHDRLREMFLPGEGRLKVRRSTSKLTVEEMTEYIETVRKWAAEELGVYIPDPNEVQA